MAAVVALLPAQRWSSNVLQSFSHERPWILRKTSRQVPMPVGTLKLSEPALVVITALAASARMISQEARPMTQMAAQCPMHMLQALIHKSSRVLLQRNKSLSCRLTIQINDRSRTHARASDPHPPVLRSLLEEVVRSHRCIRGHLGLIWTLYRPRPLT